MSELLNKLDQTALMARVDIALNREAIDVLDQLVEKGIYGQNKCEVLQHMLYRELAKAVATHQIEIKALRLIVRN